MTWNRTYLDIVEEIYWSPKYIGLQSIPEKTWQKSDEWISVPRLSVKPGYSLYTRKYGHSQEHRPDLHRYEEILNHVFDITFSIAPDVVISKLFLEPHGFKNDGPFTRLGLEIRERYNWGPSEVVTHTDGLFVSDTSIAAVELKLGSSSSPDQLAKYIALLIWEEMHSGRKDQLGLMYIIPEAAIKKHWQKCGLDGPVIDAKWLDAIADKKLSSRVRELFDGNRGHVADVLDRLRLSVVSWATIRDQIEQLRDQLDTTIPGEQTIHRLLDGFLAQLDVHDGTGLAEANYS